MGFFPACGGSDERAPSYEPSALPIPGCDGLDASACDVRTAACRERLLAVAACLREDEPGEMPAISVMSQVEFADYFRTILEDEPPAFETEDTERALTLLRLVQPGAFSVDQQVTDAAAFILGLYHPKTQQVTIVDRGGGDDERASSVLVHEFVHLLQDREFGLDAFLETYGQDADSTTAIRALVEGEAELVRTRYQAALMGIDPNRVDWRDVFGDAIREVESEILEEQSPFQLTWTAFPYIWGGRYANHLFRNGRRVAIDAAYADPPLTSYAFLASVDGVVDPAFAPLEVSPPEAPVPWQMLSSESLGAFGVFLFLATNGSLDLARGRALSWRGDAFSVFSRDDSAGRATAVSFRVEFETETAATHVANTLDDTFGPSVQRSGSSVVVALDTDGATPDWAFDL